MEKEKQPIWVRVKKGIVNNYFNLTLLYMAIYATVTTVIIYGMHYLSHGRLDYGDVKLDVLIVSLTLMFTMATMAKKLKDDIVSNYWKLKKTNNRKPKRRT